MKKLIWGTLGICLFPQVLAGGFCLMVHALLDMDVRVGFVWASGIFLLISTIVSLFVWFAPDSGPDDGWLFEYLAEKRLAAKRREEFLKKIDKEIGIPRPN